MSREKLVKSAETIIAAEGFFAASKVKIARHAGCSPSLINWHFKTLQQLHECVIMRAIRDKDIKIISLAIRSKQPLISKVPADLRKRAASFL